MSSTKKFLKLGWFIPFPANSLILASITWADFFDIDKNTERTLILLMFYGALLFLVGFIIQLMSTTLEINKLKNDLLLPDEKEDLDILIKIRRRAILYTIGSLSFVASRVFLVISFDSDQPDFLYFIYKCGLYLGYSLCCLGGFTPKKLGIRTKAVCLLHYSDILIVLTTFALTILCLFFMFMATKAIYTYWITLEFLRTVSFAINSAVFIIFY
jgi:hypothetical protein